MSERAGKSGRAPGWAAAKTAVGVRLIAALLASLLLVAGCTSGGGGPGPSGSRTLPRGSGRGPGARLGERDVDDIFLKSVMGQLIREVLTEGNPEALRQFFPADARSTVDCAGFYQQLMGAAPGTYQPRFWDTKLLAVRYLDGRQRAHTSLTLECTDLRRGAAGGGKFLPLELDWVKQGQNWFLVPAAAGGREQGTQQNR